MLLRFRACVPLVFAPLVFAPFGLCAFKFVQFPSLCSFQVFGPASLCKGEIGVWIFSHR